MGPPVVVGYVGEYEIRYTVGNTDYFKWVRAGIFGADRRDVENEVKSLPKSCPFFVKYRVDRPQDAFAIRKPGE
jgi:hypothetical protein